MNTSSSNINSTLAFGNFFSNLAKSWHISPVSLIILFCGIILGPIVFILIIIFLVRNYAKKEDEKQRLKEKRYQKAKLQITDCFDESSSKEDVLPQEGIDITMTYKQKKNILKIENMQVLNLKLQELDEPNLYLKAHLKSKNGKKHNHYKTKTIAKSATPYFSEKIYFKLKDIKSDFIHFQLFEEFTMAPDRLLGDGKLHLKEIPVEDLNKFANTRFIPLDNSRQSKQQGDLLVVLTKDFTKLKILILEAKNIRISNKKDLKVEKAPNKSVHVEVNVFIGSSQIKHFKTKKVRELINPYFHETFEITILSVLWKSFYLKIELFVSLFGIVPKRIGRVLIGSKALYPEIDDCGNNHWEFICKEHRSSKAVWHSMYTS